METDCTTDFFCCYQLLKHIHSGASIEFEIEKYNSDNDFVTLKSNSVYIEVKEIKISEFIELAKLVWEDADLENKTPISNESITKCLNSFNKGTFTVDDVTCTCEKNPELNFQGHLSMVVEVSVKKIKFSCFFWSPKILTNSNDKFALNVIWVGN